MTIFSELISFFVMTGIFFLLLSFCGGLALEQLQLDGGGKYIAWGNASINSLYPTLVPFPVVTSNTTFVAFDPVSQRFVWKITPFSTQWTLANGTYATNGPFCYYDNRDYNFTIHAYTAALETPRERLYTGLVRDPQSGPTGVTATISIKRNGRIKFMTFAQYLVVGTTQSHIQVNMVFDSYDNSFSDTVWTLPTSCYNPLDYDSTFYPTGIFATAF